MSSARPITTPLATIPYQFLCLQGRQRGGGDPAGVLDA